MPACAWAPHPEYKTLPPCRWPCLMRTRCPSIKTASPQSHRGPPIGKSPMGRIAAPPAPPSRHSREGKAISPKRALRSSIRANTAGNCQRRYEKLLYLAEGRKHKRRHGTPCLGASGRCSEDLSPTSPSESPALQAPIHRTQREEAHQRLLGGVRDAGQRRRVGCRIPFRLGRRAS